MNFSGRPVAFRTAAVRSSRLVASATPLDPTTATASAFTPNSFSIWVRNAATASTVSVTASGRNLPASKSLIVVFVVLANLTVTGFPFASGVISTTVAFTPFPPTSMPACRAGAWA